MPIPVYITEAACTVAAALILAGRHQGQHEGLCAVHPDLMAITGRGRST